MTANTYIRADDGATMIEKEPGRYVAKSIPERAKTPEPKTPKEPKKKKYTSPNPTKSESRIDLTALAKTCVTILGDGVSLRKVRGKDRIWRDAVERWNVDALADSAASDDS